MLKLLARLVGLHDPDGTSRVCLVPVSDLLWAESRIQGLLEANTKLVLENRAIRLKLDGLKLKLQFFGHFSPKHEEATPVGESL